MSADTSRRLVPKRGRFFDGRLLSIVLYGMLVIVAVGVLAGVVLLGVALRPHPGS